MLYTLPMVRKVCGGVLGTAMILAAVWTSIHAAPLDGFGPGARVLVDAHNCYPERGQHADRIERALSTGLPLLIETEKTDGRRPTAILEDPLDARNLAALRALRDT